MAQSTVSPVLFNICVYDLAIDWCASLLKSDHTKLRRGGTGDLAEGCAAIQRDLNSLERWAGGNLLQFNKEKCRVFHQERNNPRQQHMLGGIQVENSSVERAWESCWPLG